jgi:ABC-2 type transport system ATP-binding protein
MADVVIRCEGVVKRFGDVVALDRLDFEVPAGQVVGCLGPNGAGKSTTIRSCSTSPCDADVEVLGADPRRPGRASGRIGYVPGELRLDERLTVDETLRSWSRPAAVASIPPTFASCASARARPHGHVRGLSSGNRRKLGLVAP